METANLTNFTKPEILMTRWSVLVGSSGLALCEKGAAAEFRIFPFALE